MYYLVGTQKAMESLLNEMEQENDAVDDVEGDGPSMEIEVQTPRPRELEDAEASVKVNTPTISNRKRPAVSIHIRELTEYTMTIAVVLL